MKLLIVLECLSFWLFSTLQVTHQPEPKIAIICWVSVIVDRHQSMEFTSSFDFTDVRINCCIWARTYISTTTLMISYYVIFFKSVFSSKGRWCVVNYVLYHHWVPTPYYFRTWIRENKIRSFISRRSFFVYFVNFTNLIHFSINFIQHSILVL